MKNQFLWVIIMWTIFLFTNNFFKGFLGDSMFLNVSLICIVSFIIYSDTLWGLILASGIGILADIYSPYFFGLTIIISLITAFLGSAMLKAWLTHRQLFPVFILGVISHAVWSAMFFLLVFLDTQFRGESLIIDKGIIGFILNIVLNAFLITIIFMISYIIKNKIKREFFAFR